MTFSRTIFKAGALLVLFAAGLQTADAQITKAGKGYQFRMKFTQGKSYKYRMNMNMNASSMQGQQIPAMNMVMPFSMKVTGVKGNVGTIEYTIEPGTMNGKPVPNAKKQTMTVQMDNRGNMVGGNAQQLQGMGNVGYPANPIAVGQTWTATTKAGTQMPMDVKGTYKLVGIETIGGKQAAKVNVNLSGGAQGMTVSGTGTMHIDMSDGSLIQAVQNMKMNMQGNSIPMTMKITRL